jgi:hypothetical protein
VTERTAILIGMKKADSILKDALALSPADRGRIAFQLMESLNELGPPGIADEDALARKINRRIAEIDSGQAKLVDGKKALAQARARLRRRRRS